MHSQDGLQHELEVLRVEKDRQENETFILQRSLEELSSRLEAQQQAIQAKDETIAQLMGMIQSNKGLESKQLEMHKEQHSTDKKKLAEALNQLAKLREGINERERTITSLQEVQGAFVTILQSHFEKHLFFINSNTLTAFIAVVRALTPHQCGLAPRGFLWVFQFYQIGYGAHMKTNYM